MGWDERERESGMIIYAKIYAFLTPSKGEHERTRKATNAMVDTRSILLRSLTEEWRRAVPARRRPYRRIPIIASSSHHPPFVVVFVVVVVAIATAASSTQCPITTSNGGLTYDAACRGVFRH
jgi:hypothetical protein